MVINLKNLKYPLKVNSVKVLNHVCLLDVALLEGLEDPVGDVLLFVVVGKPFGQLGVELHPELEARLRTVVLPVVLGQLPPMPLAAVAVALHAPYAGNGNACFIELLPKPPLFELFFLGTNAD